MVLLEQVWLDILLKERNRSRDASETATHDADAIASLNPPFADQGANEV